MAPPGDLQPIAAQVCMKILYGARAARYDLLRAIRGLATCFTKWTTTNDRQLVRLIAYLNSTLELKMIGHVGDPIENLVLSLYTDADHAGCTRTMKSTSGVFL